MHIPLDESLNHLTRQVLLVLLAGIILELLSDAARFFLKIAHNRRRKE